MTEINFDHDDFAYDAAIKFTTNSGRSSPITSLASDSWSEEYFLPSPSCNPSNDDITENSAQTQGGRVGIYKLQRWK